MGCHFSSLCYAGRYVWNICVNIKCVIEVWGLKLKGENYLVERENCAERIFSIKL